LVATPFESSDIGLEFKDYKYFLLKSGTDSLITKYGLSRPDIIKEIELQNIVARSTNAYFEPSCPFILHSDFVVDQDITNFIDLLKLKNRRNVELFETLHMLKTKLLERKYGLTIIVMDLLPYVPLTSREAYSDSNILLESYEFIRTIINSRIISKDVHSGNFICVSDPDYFSSQYNKRFYLIDFGICEIADDDLYNQLTELYEGGNYRRMLLHIYREICLKTKNSDNLKNFIAYAIRIDDFNYKMESVIRKRNNRIKELLSDNVFFDLVKQNSILNFEWTFFLGISTKRLNGLFFEEILQKSNLAQIKDKKSYLEHKIEKFQNKLRLAIKKTDTLKRAQSLNEVDIYMFENPVLSYSPINKKKILESIDKYFTAELNIIKSLQSGVNVDTIIENSTENDIRMVRYLPYKPIAEYEKTLSKHITNKNPSYDKEIFLIMMLVGLLDIFFKIFLLKF
jgi:hypothetical protein